MFRRLEKKKKTKKKTVFLIALSVSILRKSISGRHRPVRVADGPMTARCRFTKNANWALIKSYKNHW